ncbi:MULTISPECIES: hypothetical protein [Frankia]|uniref:Uncharacterized protein n=1 Tax=Frankia alni (strain DSM 45986 / CECT 9034 / ACN14a) TaxID=326424 RepID=Q0REI2_FRAAA|nr:MULTISPECIES: hypothetical protein [Frankia]CAJ64128.1 hypothetical protein; putative signal peptide [Frankia alni ACN14a]
MKQPWWRFALLLVLFASAPVVTGIVGGWAGDWLDSGTDGYAAGGFMVGGVYVKAAHRIYASRPLGGGQGSSLG